MTAARVEVDLVTTEVIRNAFLAAAADMKEALVRSAHSPVIYEMEDCGVALLNEKAETVGQAAGLASFPGYPEPGGRDRDRHGGHRKLPAC